MAIVKVGSLSGLPPGSVMEVTLGEDSYAICNAAGELHAPSGICPHAGGPIGQGNLQEHLVVCPWHEWAYDCRTGENDYDPAFKLDRFVVKTEGDDMRPDRTYVHRRTKRKPRRGIRYRGTSGCRGSLPPTCQ